MPFSADFQRQAKRAKGRRNQSVDESENSGPSTYAEAAMAGARLGGDDADEHTTLLGNGNGNGNGLLHGDLAQKNSTMKFLFHTTQAPGTDSDNKLVKWSASTWHTCKVTLLSSYVNVLVVFVPLGIVAGMLNWNPTVVFVFNFFAIVPLAAILAFATEEISIRLGQTLGGLMNATFGNAVELIVSIIALMNGEISIVQSSMLGSILSNILLVLGCAFIAGGIHNTRTGTRAGIEQNFNGTAASTMSSLLVVSTASLIIPATLYSVLSRQSESSETSILTLSHGTSIVLLVLYGLYLTFQLRTHASLFDAEQQGDEQEEEQEEEKLGPWAAAGVLVVSTVVVAICADYLVKSIDSLVASTGISKTFVGLILLPIVGNAAEHVSSIIFALRDKMDISLGISIGSSMQISLLVTPVLVILGWIIGQPMTLHFQTFETVIFFLSVLVVTYVVNDGKSNWLEGSMLVGLYFIIALAFIVYPDDLGPGKKIGADALVARAFNSLTGS